MTVKLRKFLIRMSKLSICAMIICQSISLALADDATAQRKKLSEIDLNVTLPESTTLKHLVSRIEEQGVFTFVYSKNRIGKTVITLDRPYGNMMELLNELSVQARVNIRRVNETIVLKEIDAEAPVPLVEDRLMQDISVSGTITDENGEALPGASIVEKGTANGTITDIDGNFSLNVNDNASLLVSFVGYVSQEIQLNGRTSLEISMKPDFASLEEVVVVGYGTTTKKDVTGAIVSVDFEDANIAPNTSILQAVQGKVPGINIGAVSDAGQNPSISIRGQNSLSANNNPLIVVDGVIYSGSILDFATTDIKNIDFLKDASAAAVYGSRAANGVVLITTKSGKNTEGKPDISFNMYTGIQEASHLLELMNGEQYAQKVLDYREASGQVADPNDLVNYLQPTEVDNYLNGTDVDWYDLLLRTAPISNYEVGISGRTNKTRYYFSGTYTDQDGIIVGDDFKRTTLRANFSNEITDWLTVGFNTSFSHRDYSGNAVGFGNSVLSSPLGIVYQVDNPTEYELFPGTDQLIANPLLSALPENVNIQDNLFGVFNIDIKLPVEGLTFKHSYSRTLYFSRQSNFNIETTGGINANGQAYKSNDFRDSWLMNNILDYSKTFNAHKIGATVVYTRDHYYAESTDANATGFANPLLGFDALELGEIQTVNSGANDNSSEGFMTRINYGYDNRYLVTGTFRRDGFSGFASNNKYANFFSASLAWVISEESFLSGASWLDFLKLRLSYGENGNQGLGSYSSLATVGTSQYVFGDGGSTAIGIETNSISNPNLKWETTKSTNFGINFDVFNGRLSGDIDYYISKTNDLLVQRSLLRYTGYSSIWTNLGEIKNNGFEVYLNSVNLEIGDLKWETGFTFSLNRNEIVSLYGEDADGDGVEDDDVSRGWFIGESLGSIYNFKIGRIYQLDDTDIPTGFKAGDFEIIDTDGVDGISNDDRTIYGNENPNYRFGITNNLTYKQFTLSAFINSIQGGGNYWYMADNRMLNPNTYFPDRANMINIPYWTASNPTNDYPRIDYNPAFRHRFDQSRSFVRLQDVTLAYDMSKLGFADKLKLNRLRVYASGKNLATWTKWTGYDPELGSTLSGKPIMRSYIVGVEIGF